MYKKLTPVLVVDAIEPVLPFWKTLGFTTTAEVPQGDRLGFVILTAGDVEVMYQTFDSVREDEKHVLDGPRAFGANALFVVVDDIEKLAAQLPRDADVIVERRTTFYGSTEVIVRDPVGNVVSFAQMKA